MTLRNVEAILSSPCCSVKQAIRDPVVLEVFVQRVRVHRQPVQVVLPVCQYQLCSESCLDEGGGISSIAIIFCLLKMGRYTSLIIVGIVVLIELSSIFVHRGWHD